jgi:hypothetical protein
MSPLIELVYPPKEKGLYAPLLFKPTGIHDIIIGYPLHLSFK